MNYASIVPLIGGETFGMEQVFKKRPDYILSYSPFRQNDEHLLNYYDYDVPYHVLDSPDYKTPHKVDVVNAVCPCAGLSSLSISSSADSEINDWLYKSSEYVLENIQPKVFWGENAPALATKKGEAVRNSLRAIGKKFGYTFTVYKTKSLLHGLPQTRNRSFYFFWKDNVVPKMSYFNRKHIPIQEFILQSARNEPDEMSNILINDKKPSDDPWYAYILDQLYPDKTHAQFIASLDRSKNVNNVIEENNVSYLDVGKWMTEHGYEKQAKKCEYIHDKHSRGLNTMQRDTNFPADYIGAFVGAYPFNLAHPTADRYLNLREALDIMKMPRDFQLLGGRKNVNHICQNVPVTTAADMASDIQKYLAGELDTINTDYTIEDNHTQKVTYNSTSSLLDQFG